MTNLDHLYLIQNDTNTTIIIYKAKDHQIKYKTIHKHHFNLSLHDHGQPQSLLTFKINQPI